MTSATVITQTLTDIDVSGGTISIAIPTLSGVTYFQAYGSHGGSDSIFLSNKVSWGDTVAPTITSSATQSQMELFPLAVSLTANETVSWSITGGDDRSQFTVTGSTLQWFGNGTQNFTAPVDSDTNNSYIVQVTATDLGGNITNQTITVTVTAADKTPDAFSLGSNIVPATVGTTYTSSEVVVSGVTAGVPITTTVSGMNYLYKPAGGSYGTSQSPGTFNVYLGDAIKLTTVATTGSQTGTLNMNGVSANWTVAQQLDPSSTPNLTAWYDPSDLTTLFQDTAGTVPVTADGQTVALMKDKSGHGNHLSQATAGNRPTYHTAAGKSWLTFAAGNKLQQGNFASLGTATIIAALNIPTYSNFRVFMSDTFGATDINSPLHLIKAAYGEYGPHQ
jgi:hypothetical protein